MRKHAHKAIYTVLAVGILVLVALFLKDSTDSLKKGTYDALAPTDTKFARLARWIPVDSEFDVTVDIPKALANPKLRNRLIEMVVSHSGVAAELVDALIKNEGEIGLLTLAGTLGERGIPLNMVIIAQGQFNKDVMLPIIRKAMSDGRAGLSAKDVEWSTIYYESDEREPFGFMILDGSHMAVGQRASLETFFLEKPKPPEAITAVSEDVIFGHLEIGERLKSLAPKLVKLPNAIVFSSTDGIILTATAPCDSAIQAMSLRMFLGGVRSLLMIQHENYKSFTDILDGISIASEGSELKLTMKLAPLLDLWSDESVQDEINSPLRNVDESSASQP